MTTRTRIYKLPKEAEPYKFKKGQSGNPLGRRANPIPNALKNLTLQQYRRIIKAVVKGNYDEIVRIIEDPKTSGLELGLAKCFKIAIDRGDYDTIEKMLQRIVGKIPDEVNVNSRNLTVTAKLKKVNEARVEAVVERLLKET